MQGMMIPVSSLLVHSLYSALTFARVFARLTPPATNAPPTALALHRSILPFTKNIIETILSCHWRGEEVIPPAGFTFPRTAAAVLAPAIHAKDDGGGGERPRGIGDVSRGEWMRHGRAVVRWNVGIVVCVVRLFSRFAMMPRRVGRETSLYMERGDFVDGGEYHGWIGGMVLRVVSGKLVEGEPSGWCLVKIGVWCMLLSTACVEAAHKQT